MDKRPIILIIINSILIVIVPLIAYFTFGFRSVDPDYLDVKSNSVSSEILIDGVELHNVDSIPNVSKCEITIVDGMSIKIKLNPNARISYMLDGELKNIMDIEPIKLLALEKIGNHIVLNTSKRTLTMMLHEIYDEKVSEIMECKEEWLFEIVLGISGSNFNFKIYDVGVDIGPSSIEFDKQGIII